MPGLSDLVRTTVKTAAATDADNEDDASQFDVTAPRHLKRLLLISMGQRSTTKLVLLPPPRTLFYLKFVSLLVCLLATSRSNYRTNLIFMKLLPQMCL